MKMKILMTIISGLIVISIALFAFSYMIKKKEVVPDGFVICKSLQYLAEEFKSQTIIELMIIDSADQTNRYRDVPSCTCNIITTDNRSVENVDYSFLLVDSNEKYSIYTLIIIIENSHLERRLYEFDRLEFNLAGTVEAYFLGSIKVDLSRDLDNSDSIKIGSSLFAGEDNKYTIFVTNRCDNDIVINSFYCDINVGADSILTDDIIEVSIPSYSEKEVVINLKETNDSNILIKPLIGYTREGEQFWISPIIATKYKSTISQEEIISLLSDATVTIIP